MSQAPTVLVTGGAGFIGSAVVRHLIGETGWSVVNLDRLSYAASPAALFEVKESPRHRFVHGDIRDRDLVSSLLAEHRPCAVLHLAAETHVDRSIDGPEAFMEHNLMGSFHLLEAVRAYWSKLSGAEAAQFRYVQVSTDEVFGSLGPDDAAFNLDTQYQPRSPYSASKAGGDHLARAWAHTWGLPVMVTNCTNNYGPYQFPEKLIPLMILRGLRGEPLPVYGTGANRRDWLHVEDHARGLCLALERGQPGGTYLFGGGTECSNLEVVDAICRILDRLKPADRPRRDLIQMVADRPGHDFRYAMDASSTLDGLGWSPAIGFDEGIARTVQWYLDHCDWWEPILASRYDGSRLGLG
ncbi:dTDP-glucose 4 6-dehydratase [Paramagnetospirillum magnetotacticum MS-1]|uniref:dTDP-glucose 4,6-dehydratase n=1 Tax=Paramagnetospirillum magnetotacticum MS-1 TaxID=272627 RepID=A0A0C2UFA0_PARME|nr:dTDP-glucose 4,6-dehydratase [Paramagnetospirillum magnetotacticum]KIM00178.1 dTDP-glucose 4 6-dehydratase [Paramagnetospirillum magnetotacticum MS-1]